MSEIPPGSKPNYGSAIRLGQIVDWLHQAPLGISITELKSRLGVSERTLARYIQTLKDNFDDEEGESLVELARIGRHSRLRFRRKRLEMSGSAYELMSLYMALDLMNFMAGTFFHQGAQEVLDRLQDVLLRSHGNQTNLILKDFHKKFFHWTEAPKDYSSHNEVLEKLVKALVIQRKVQLVYQSPGKPEKSHKIMPLTLLMYKRALYLVGRKGTGKDEQTRDLTFAVERIAQVRVFEESFHYPFEYEPQQRFQSSFGLVHDSEPEEVALWFDAQVAANVSSRRWHSSQKTQSDPGGGLTLSLFTEVGLELISWVLSYGPLVKVLKPESLRAKVASRLRAALELYDHEPTA